MSMLCSIADAVSSGSWPILFKILTLSVAICAVLLHQSNFCSCLSSVADFSNSRTRTIISAERAPCLSAPKIMCLVSHRVIIFVLF